MRATAKSNRRTRHAALCAAAARAAVSLCAAGPAGDESAPLEPLWQVKLPSVEWAAPVGGDRPVILVCGADHRIRVLDAADGSERLAPQAFGPGTRFAGSAAGADAVAYVYDRYSLAALGPDPAGACSAPPWKLLWQSGEAFDPAGVEGDPEFLTRIVAVTPTVRGVAVLRSDGMGAELAQLDGRRLRTFGLPRAETARLLSDGAMLVALRRSSGRTAVQFLSEQPVSGAAAALELGRDWPLWSALHDGALLALDPAGLTIVRPGAAPRRWVHAAAAPLLAAGTARLLADPPGVLVADADGGIHAIDAAVAAPAWRISGVTAAAEPWVLTSCGPRLVAAATSARLLVCEAGSGAPLLLAPTPSVRAVHVGDHRVWAVMQEPGGRRAARVQVWSFVRLSAPAPVRLISPPPTVLVLRCGADVREWVWTEKTLIAVEPGGLAAFCLP